MIKNDENKTKSEAFLLDFSKNDYFVPEPIERLQNYEDAMVPFGTNNTFPQDCLFLIENTSLVGTIVDKVTKYIFGEGITSSSTLVTPELVYGIVNDYVIFNAFALQVRRNSFGDIAAIDRLKVERIRTNEDNSIIWYSKKWSKYAKPNLKYEMYNGSRNQSDSILYFKNPSSRHVYGFSSWWSAMTDVATAFALSDYSINAVNNCFAPSAVISLCDGKPQNEEELRAVEKSLNEKFSGTKNAAKLLVTFSDNKDTAPIVTTFQSADLNAHFISLKESIETNIFTAFSMDPLLIGKRTTTGVFSESAYKEAFDLFNATEIKPIQEIIKKAIKKLGIDIEFTPFNIEWSTDKQ